MKFEVFENDNFKDVRSENYNYTFSKNDGYFARWGKMFEDDPKFSPFGPELLDIEITDICNGPGGVPCKFCYKSNSPNNKNYMSFETYKRIFDNIPDVTTQIAFGVDAQCVTNPDWYKIFTYTRDNGIIPNATVADIDMETGYKLSRVCGAVAVSRYEDSNLCYDSVSKLTALGMKQVNIHQLICQETLDQVYQTMFDSRHDFRLKKLNAIVFLSLKQKGRGINHTPLTQEQFNDIVEYAMKYNVPIGFDSCSCNKFLESVKHRTDYKKLETMAEPCESSLFSFYVNTEGYGFPCSFVEGENEWKKGIDMTNIHDFYRDV